MIFEIENHRISSHYDLHIKNFNSDELKFLIEYQYNPIPKGGHFGARLRLSKNPFGAFQQIFQAAARIICSPLANKFHTCRLRSFFRQVHAPAENEFEWVAAEAANSAKLF